MSARRIDPEAQEAIATARFIRMSPTKARQVVDLIRGRHVDDARRVLTFTNRAATDPVLKVLESAIANAEHNRQLPADELLVARAWVDEGPTLRRFRPRAMGRATRIRKRTCHISVVVGRDQQILAELRDQKPAARKSTASSDAAPAKKTTRRRAAGGGGEGTAAKKTTARRAPKKKEDAGTEKEEES